MHVNDLMLKWKCGQKTCPNEDSWCYIIDGIHLRIFPQQMTAWSVAINDEEQGVTLEVAPETVAKALMPAKQGQKNPLRHPQDDKTPKTPAPVIPPYPSYPMPPYPYYSPYGHPQHGLPPPPPFHQVDAAVPSLNSTTSATTNLSEPDLRSSPPFEQDPVERMIKYIDWLAKVSPTQATMLSAAKERLLSKGHSFRTLSQISDVSFIAMEISDGLAILLKSEIKAFKKAETRGRL